MPLTPDITVKSIPEQWMASVREIIPTYQDVGKLCGRVAESLGPAMADSTIAFAIWHDQEYKPSDVDAEAGFYLKNEVPAPNGIKIHQMPATTVASILHKGAYRSLPNAYKALGSWIAENGYTVAGPFRELYLFFSTPVRQDDESYVTEVQVPVEKV